MTSPGVRTPETSAHLNVRQAAFIGVGAMVGAGIFPARKHYRAQYPVCAEKPGFPVASRQENRSAVQQSLSEVMAL